MTYLFSHGLTGGEIFLISRETQAIPHLKAKPMRHFPIFLDTSDARIVVAGAGETAVAKLRLLLKTEARIDVFGVEPVAQVVDWAREGRISLYQYPLGACGLMDARLVYAAADENPDEDARVARLGRGLGVLVNSVDHLEGSDFITPAMVDRDPVVVAIGTEGAAPVLARRIKADVEAALPSDLGLLARVGQAFRPLAERLPMGLVRREFWSKFYFERGPRAFAAGGAEQARDVLEDLLSETLAGTRAPGSVALVGAGPGDAELLTRKAARLLHEADVVVHDRLVGAGVLELARREAEVICVGKTGFGPAWRQEEINALLVEKAEVGAKVVRLKGGDAVIFARLEEELDALDEAGIAWEIVPGITAASAAAASLGRSLTSRGRNSELRILTGRDVKGFAEQDWRALAAPGAVAAIYMGKRAAVFLRGRMMVAGAPGTLEVTVVENASRSDQCVHGTSLLKLPEVVAACEGPAVILLGISPRRAVAADIQEILKEGAK